MSKDISPADLCEMSKSDWQITTFWDFFYFLRLQARGKQYALELMFYIVLFVTDIWSSESAIQCTMKECLFKKGEHLSHCNVE